MKKFIRPVTILIISLFLALAIVAFSATGSTESSKFSKYSNSALFFQITTTPQPVPVEDRSEIGSTDGLTLMSFIIVLIIIIPIFLKRKNWSQA